MQSALELFSYSSKYAVSESLVLYTKMEFPRNGTNQRNAIGELQVTLVTRECYCIYTVLHFAIERQVES
eukprot:5641982-Pyramimonas_sp.AAC.1